MSRAHQYPRLILAVVCLPVFIGALDLTIVSAVLPEVIRSMTVEIQKLEGRLKVNIVLVPNPHLETPHYKVQRLKHDELN